MNNSRFSLFFSGALIAVVAVFIGIVIGIMFQRSIWVNKYETMVTQDKLQYTIDMLSEKYVDSLSRDSLIEIVLPDLLSHFDPHSEYIPQKNVQTVNEPLNGKFDGIGVMFNMMTDTAQITNVISGGPSSKVGVMAGDRIMTVDDSLVAGRKIDSDKLVKKLRGPKGTKVTLGLQRGDNPQLVKIAITRGEIPMRSVESAFMIRPGVAYIKVARFAATTYKEFMTAMAKLSGQGMKSVVIDLRDNGGGLLDQAIVLANEFLNKDQIIVYTQGNRIPRHEERSDGSGQYRALPVSILIGPESASASEIFAGAMQDNDRATIIGLRSFGKGLIQEQISYPDGAAARITVAHYYTPLGRSIQKPYKPGDRADYNMELYNRYRGDELLNADSIARDTKQRFVTAGGKILYGGGGIIPDIFVGIDTTRVSDYFKKLVEKNLVFRYAAKFSDDHRSEVNSVKTFADMDVLTGKTSFYIDFVAWAGHQGVSPGGSDLEVSRTAILSQLRAYIGRNTALEDNALYYYFYPLDKTMQRAVEGR